MAADRGVGTAVRRLRDGAMVVLYDEQRDQGDLLAAAELWSNPPHPVTTAAAMAAGVQAGATALPVTVLQPRSLR